MENGTVEITIIIIKKKKNFLPTQQRDKYKKGYKNIIEIFFGTYRKSEK